MPAFLKLLSISFNDVLNAKDLLYLPCREVWVHSPSFILAVALINPELALHSWQRGYTSSVI